MRFRRPTVSVTKHLLKLLIEQRRTLELVDTLDYKFTKFTLVCVNYLES